MPKHTAEPWSVVPPSAEHPSRAMVSGRSGQVLIYSAPLTNETAANARLIAAAPELLRALENLLREADDDGITRAGVDQALAAIAKAKEDPCLSAPF